MEYKPIYIIDMTSTFNKERFIYALCDIHFPFAVRVSQVGYTLLLIGIWAIPFFNIVGFNVISLIFGIGPSFLLGWLFSKPIWGGKTFFSFITCLLAYFFSPKEYYDLKATHPNRTYDLCSEILVSRHKDYAYLVWLRNKELLQRRSEK